jgi:hypothetical protein
VVAEEWVKQGRVEDVMRCSSAVLSGNGVVVVRGAGLTELLDGGGLLLLERLGVGSSVRRRWLFASGARLLPPLLLPVQRRRRAPGGAPLLPQSGGGGGGWGKFPRL